MKPPCPITAVLLCGGAGSRLGGIDKPLRALAGRPLIEHLLARLRPQVTRVVISANRNRERYAGYTEQVLDDGDFIGCGPLAGMLAGLEAAQATELLCVPGDAPLLPLDLLQRLAAARDAQAAAIAFAHDGRGPQPLCCLLPARLRTDLHGYLESGGRSPRKWFDRHAAASVDFSDAPGWAWSLNTEAEWALAERHLLESSPQVIPA